MSVSVSACLRADVIARSSADGSWRLLCTSGAWLLQGQIVRAGRVYRFMAPASGRPAGCDIPATEQLGFRSVRLYPQAVAPDALAGHQSEMPPPQKADAVFHLTPLPAGAARLTCTAGDLCRWVPDEIVLEPPK